MECQDDKDAYLPSEAEIKAGCRKIQKSWTRKERRKRRVRFFDRGTLYETTAHIRKYHVETARDGRLIIELLGEC